MSSPLFTESRFPFLRSDSSFDKLSFIGAEVRHCVLDQLTMFPCHYLFIGDIDFHLMPLSRKTRLSFNQHTDSLYYSKRMSSPSFTASGRNR